MSVIYIRNKDGTLTPISSSNNVKTVNGVEPDENGNIEIAIPDSGGNADYVGVEPAYEDIPKIFFGGALQQTKDEKVVPFRYISKTDDFSGYAEIKAQGNSSMSYPKKNQTVKMFKDADCTEKMKVDFKGWGKQNKHVYKANWIDLTHSRNVVSARLWGDVVKSRTNYAELPELLRTSPNQGAVDGFPVKVYANGIYQGRYTINIPKDAWMANMDKDLDTHCILCGENYVSGCFRASANINESDWTDEIHDTVPASIKTRWNQVISFVMNSTDEEFRAKLSQYFYVDSLIDYYLFGLASCGLDAFGKNQLYMTYDGQTWIATMHDMDSTWGLYYNGQKFVGTDYGRDEYEDYVNSTGNLLYVRLEQLFWSKLQTRWAELKNGALSITNIINRFERFTDIAPAELVKEDYKNTTGDGKFTGIPSQSTNNIQQIRAFALARQAWTDEYVAGLTPEVEVPCTGITLNTSTLTFTGEGAQTLTATVTPDGCTDVVTWESNNTSIATVYGGVVTAVANGNATITAKCGEYSASCSVAVSGIEEESGTVENTIETANIYMNASINGDTGAVINNAGGEFYIDGIDCSQLNGADILCEADETPTCLKIVFYDENKTFISGKYVKQKAALAVTVPDGAKYMAVAAYTNVTVMTLSTLKDKHAYAEGEPGVYKAADGTKNDSDSKHVRLMIPLVAGDAYYVNNSFVSGAYFDSNGDFHSSLNWVNGGYSGRFVVPDGVGAIGINVANSGESVTKFALYTTVTQIGQRTIS